MYIGSTPMLQQTLLSSPQIIMDDSTENDPWVPMGHATPDMVQRSSHEVSTFIMAGKAAVVLNRALLRFYCNASDKTLTEVTEEDAALMDDALELERSMPLHLRVDHDKTAPTHLYYLW